ncbi:amino acid permease-associated region [Methylocella silvestris BL2]|uniref:Amino acid permease-associated region n=1 Tax=Methylocella silvestris (strain DSM 15510 / CIP 108128 / LMG 27833 / NCIMB 13906 / BL2) TaxID=395965 RepID=B8ETA7_METSB|nr:APC family permease [Methylocella silvestris]ACK51749.1 amino acid permease-associated region [Methylocella silvestris BL2]
MDLPDPVRRVADAAQPSRSHGSLRRDCLSYPEVLSQSISVIAPSTVPAAVLGLIFATSGNGTWLSFALGMVGLVLVSLNINQFARRSASPGSLYTYIVKGLGPTAGVLGGWALAFGYTVTGMSTLCGFSIVAGLMLQRVGVHVNPMALFALASLGAFFIAKRDVQLSAKMMLVLEGAALALILFLGFLIWKHEGFAVDAQQVTLAGATPGGVLAGIVLVVFGFSGFESSTSLGGEAKDPLRSIPRSVIQSVVVSGLIFIFMAYVVILAFNRGGGDLGSSESPLQVLAERMGLGFFGVAINLGILVSFFACTLAAINSTARIMFSMARHGLIFDALGDAHETNKTPHVAIGVATLITFLAPAIVYLAGVTAFDAQGYFGTLCSFGFLVTYVLISLAPLPYLRSIGKLTPGAAACSALGTGFMILPFLGSIGIPGSTLFPPPDSHLLLYLFVAYMAVGLAWLMFERFRRPKMIPAMHSAIEALEAQFVQSANVLEQPIR